MSKASNSCLIKFFIDKEKELIKTLDSWNLVSEDDIKAKHYSLIEKDIGKIYGVLTEWRVKNVINHHLEGLSRGRFDLVAVKKWKNNEPFKKEYYKKYNPIYAVEYKVDDTKTQLKKAQVTGFVKQVKRLVDYLLADNADLDRAFALYHYRGEGLNGEERLKEEIEKLNLQKDLNLRIVYVHHEQEYDLLNIES